MTQEQYIKEFYEWAHSLIKLTSKKNRDYAEKNDAFKNFEQIKVLTNGKISVEEGIFIRMIDKMSRIGTLLTKENEVKDETILDTLNDLAVYSGILRIYLESKND